MKKIFAGCGCVTFFVILLIANIYFELQGIKKITLELSTRKKATKTSLVEILKWNNVEIDKKTKDALEKLEDYVLKSGDEIKYENSIEGMSEKQVLAEAKLLAYLDKNISWELIPKFFNKDIYSYTSEYEINLPPKGVRNTFRKISYISEYLKYNKRNIDCSKLYSVSLKLAAINEKSSLIGYIVSGLLPEINSSYYYILENDLFTAEELSYINKSIEEYLKQHDTLQQIFNQEFDDLISYFTELEKKEPGKTKFVNIVFGNTIEVLNEFKKAVNAKDYRKYTQLFEENYTHIFLTLTVPSYENVYKQVIDAQSRFAIFQAYIQSKLNLPITAKDPENERTIKYEEKNGKKIFYCLGAFNLGEKILSPIRDKDAKKQEERLKKIK